MMDPYSRPDDYAKQMKTIEAERTKIDNDLPADPVKNPPQGATPTGNSKTFIGNPVAAATHYAGDMFAEIQRYAALAAEIARNESFDLVHAHDWMTFPAGLAVAGLKGVPLVVHVHSTEFDRAGVHVDQRIYDIERRGKIGR